MNIEEIGKIEKNIIDIAENVTQGNMMVNEIIALRKLARTAIAVSEYMYARMYEPESEEITNEAWDAAFKAVPRTPLTTNWEKYFIKGDGK